MIQAGADYRLDESALNDTYVRLQNGEMSPISQFITLRKIYGAESLNRFNMYNSIGVNAMPADGFSSGEAIKAVRKPLNKYCQEVIAMTSEASRERKPSRITRQ